MHMAD